MRVFSIRETVVRPFSSMSRAFMTCAVETLSGDSGRALRTRPWRASPFVVAEHSLGG
jgi:hypothetical protein